MNCSQVRDILATYREATIDPTDTTELEKHLEHCEACKDAYAQHQFIGERIRSMPRLEPSLDAHDKLMQALAVEHVRFLQRTATAATSTPAPAFLAPYLKDLARKNTQKRENLAAFSTADTGPLPIIRPVQLRARRTHTTRQIAILGAAAAVLMVLMAGGVLSLLVLSSQGGQTSTAVIIKSNSQESIENPTLINVASVTTTAEYPHVASAIIQNNATYYTDYSNDGSSWMLEQMDSKNNSTPLLAAPRTRPMIVLGSVNNWLFWLQMNPVLINKNSVNQTQPEEQLAGSWSLRALDLTKEQSIAATTPPTDQSPTSQTDNEVANSIVLHEDTFNPAKAPSWITDPIQSFKTTKSTVLVSYVDKDGIAHVVSYPFMQNTTDQQSTIGQATTIATGTAGHIYTSLTANVDGSVIFWSDEWMQNNNQLASNIWTQQIVNAQPTQQGQWVEHPATEKYLYLTGTNSFHPQLVNSTLFILSRESGGIVPTSIQPTTSATVQPTATLQATATPKIQATATQTATPTVTPTQVDMSGLLGGDTRIDPTISPQPIDESVVGKILAFTDNGAIASQNAIADKASDIQGGGQFLIWQDTVKSNFGMYDDVANTLVTVDGTDIPQDAVFMNVNGTTAVWTRYINPANVQTNTIHATVSFGSFKWPTNAASGN